MGKNKDRQDKRPRIESDESTDKSMDKTTDGARTLDASRCTSTSERSVIEQVLASNEFKELLQRIEEQDDRIKALEDDNNNLRARLAIAEGSMTRADITTSILKEKVVDLTSRSMRDNIVIKNIDETTENLEESAMVFFKDVMKISTDNLKKIQIERIHRAGKYITGRKRIVIAKLNSKGKDIVMSHIKYIPRDSQIRVTDQHPPEVHANREKLWPVFVEAKSAGKQAIWRQDTLHVDGKVINPPQDRISNINIDTTTVATNMKVKHTAIFSKGNCHVQGHVVDVSSTDDVVPALRALQADPRVAGASNFIYAYRIGTDKYNFHNWEDDNEWGAGRCVMEAIRNNNVFNKLVCVTQWNGQKHRGQVKFDTIREVTNHAVQL